MHAPRGQPAHRHRRAVQGAAEVLQVTLLSSRIKRILFPDLQPIRCLLVSRVNMLQAPSCSMRHARMRSSSVALAHHACLAGKSCGSCTACRAGVPPALHNRASCGLPPQAGVHDQVVHVTAASVATCHVPHAATP